MYGDQPSLYLVALFHATNEEQVDKMTDENTTDEVSRQAHDRMTAERDKLKAQVAELKGSVDGAQSALGDFAKIDSAYEYFKGRQIDNPYGLAREAVLNPQVRTADNDGLPEALDGWYNHQKEIFGTPAPVTEETAPPEPVAPMTQPNPAAPGTPSIGGAPLLIGSPEYAARYGGMSRDEQLAAHRRGETVFPPEVQAAQSTISNV